ncbi:MAG TPA: hypothetical protein DCQ98_16540 [Planctomycetaceae bacterium]|nr:hypothetical protein [Planctomycetaceae bacterium]
MRLALRSWRLESSGRGHRQRPRVRLRLSCFRTQPFADRSETLSIGQTVTRESDDQRIGAGIETTTGLAPILARRETE